MKTNKLGLSYLLNLALKYCPLIIVLMILVAIDSATYSYVSMFIKYIIAVLDNNEIKNTLPSFIINFFESGSTVIIKVIYASIGLALFQVCRGILKFLTGCYREIIGETISRNIRIEMYQHIQDLSYSYHNNVDTGDLIQRCTTDNEVIKNFLSSQLPEVVSTFSILIFAGYQMAFINKTLMLVSLLIIPVSFTMSIIFCLYVEKKYTVIEDEEAKLMTIIQENLSGVRVVKAFANEKFENEKFSNQSKKYANLNVKLNKKFAIFWGLNDFMSMAQYLLVTAISIYLAMHSSAIDSSDIVALLMLVGSFIWPVRSLGRMIGESGKSFVAAGRIKEILNYKSEYENDSKNTPYLNGQISFKNVGFKFDDTDEHLLNNLSFDINPGETIAIIGKTGSGKSTVAKLLDRFYDYQEGSITLNGNELRDINKKYLRTQVGLILQEPFLYTRTVYDNIAITNPEISKEKVYNVARISAIEKDINSFEKGYETIVGEKGTTLSGGQKQRVSIARMLLINKPIIIFDDSLSAVDTETDLMIRNGIKNREAKSTMIIITHRITTAKQADKIIVLDGGTVSQIGTHDSLSKAEGLYKKLWDIQGAIEDEFMKLLDEGGEK